jgi:hypothetical protein
MGRRIIVPVLLVAMALSFMPAHAAGNTVCTLAGSAHFTPGAKLTNQLISYTFSGKLANCNGTDKTAKSATVNATGKGTFSCVGGSSKGTASIRWNNGKTSAATFATNNYAALVRITGHISSGEYGGANVTGLIVFEANAVGCIAGLPSANFNGAVRAA